MLGRRRASSGRSFDRRGNADRGWETASWPREAFVFVFCACAASGCGREQLRGCARASSATTSPPAASSAGASCRSDFRAYARALACSSSG